MIVLLLSLALVVPALQGGATREVTIDKETIRLGDVVLLETWDARSEVELGRAPVPGAARRFHDYELISKIRSAGYAEDGLSLPAEVLVFRAARSLDEGEIRLAIAESLRNRFPDSSTSVLELIVPPADVATGPIELSATLPQNFRSGETTSVRIDVVGDDYQRSLHVRAVMAIETSQPVLRRDISAQSSILPGDIEWQVLPLESATDSIVDAGALAGYVAKHDLRAGVLVTEDLLYAPIMVRRGDTVSVEARVGNVVVSAVMEAEETGKYGDVIQAGHLSGGGQARVRIVGPGRVEALQGGIQ